MLYIIKEHVYWYAKFGVSVVFGSSSSINGLDEIFGCESLPLSHVTRSHSPDRESTSKMLPRVHQSPLGAFNINHYNPSDERLRWNNFKLNRHPIRVRRAPPHLSEDQRSRFDLHDRTLQIFSCHLRIKINKSNPTLKKS